MTIAEIIAEADALEAQVQAAIDLRMSTLADESIARRDAFRAQHFPLLVAVAEAAVEMRDAEHDDPNSMDVPYPVGPFAVHRCGCPATKLGKTCGPCDCGGDALQARIRASRVALDAALRGEGKKP